MFLFLRDLRRKEPFKILNSLCISLLALYIIFLGGIEQTQSVIGCTVITALLQFFVVSSLMWTSAEGMNLFYLIVMSRTRLLSNFLVKAHIICWGTYTRREELESNYIDILY